MERYCFVCTTPYQIVAASVIAESLSITGKSDLYIISQFKGVEEYKKRIEKTYIFSEVIIPDLSGIESYKKAKNKLTYNLGIIKNYLNCKRIAESITQGRQYQKLFISSQANVGRLLSLAFKYRYKEKCETVFFDDGEGSYDNDRITNTFGNDRIIRTLIFGRESCLLGKSFYLYSPELYKDINGNDFEINPIENWSKDKNLLNLVNQITGYTPSDCINEKIVLIDTIPSETFSDDGQKVYQRVIQMLIEKFKMQMIIKKHPRDSRKPFKNASYYKGSSIPFEVICANSDLNDKVLIAASSTAVLMPKLLFDAEPTVILLYKMMEVKVGNSQKREQFINYICSSYRDKDKIIIPSSMAELEKVVNRYSNISQS